MANSEVELLKQDREWAETLITWLIAFRQTTDLKIRELEAKELLARE